MVLIEQMIYEHLNYCYEAGELSAPAYLMRPENLPTKYVLVEKTGTNETNHITSATIAIQSIAGRLYDAAVLNSEVKNCMRDFVGFDAISKCECTNDYNFTNVAAKQPRYQAVFEVVFYEE